MKIEIVTRITLGNVEIVYLRTFVLVYNTWLIESLCTLVPMLRTRVPVSGSI